MVIHRKKIYISATVCLLMVLSMLVIPTSQAFAKNSTTSVNPDRVWDVSGQAESKHTGQIKALVYDFEEQNGKIYVGGKFLSVVNPSRTKTYDQSFLAAFDMRTGTWDSSFRPKLDGPVYSLDTRADGKLLAGGEMTGGVVALDPRSGAKDAQFNPGIKHSWGKPAVFDVEVVGNSFYAGGTFATANGSSADRLGRFDATTGKIDSTWKPTTQAGDGEVVYGIAVDTTRERVYVVGKFGGLNGNTDAAYFGTLDTKSGALKTGVPQGIPRQGLSHVDGWSMWQHDVQIRGNKVFIGGQGHQTLILNADNLQAENSYMTDKGVDDKWFGGDTQVIFVGQNTVWSGCHCWGSVGPYKLGSYSADPRGRQTLGEYYEFLGAFRTTDPFGQQKVNGLYGVDLDSREVLPVTFDLSGAAGAWALYEDSLGQLWAGGEFTSGGGNKLSGIARFAGARNYSTDGSIPSPETATPVPFVDQPVAPVPVVPAAPVVPAPAPVVPAAPAPAQPAVANLATTNCRRGPVPAQFDVTTVGNASIYRLYCAYFLRHPDTGGFAYWANTYAAGTSLRDIAFYFQGGEEFAKNHADKSDAEFVNWVYKIVMERNPDADGYAYWTGLLNRNEITRSDVVFYFSESGEFRVRTGTN